MISSILSSYGLVAMLPGMSGETNMKTLFWNNKRVLVTGHTGFKGSWLSLLLLRLGADVSGYSLPPEQHHCLFNELFPKLPSKTRLPYLSGHIIHHIGDIADFHALSMVISSFQPEIVLHLAAQPLVRHSYKDPLSTWNTNVMGTLTLLETLKASSTVSCSVIIVTTDKVYSNQEWIYGYRETDSLGGIDPYSASKAASEIAVDSWRNSFCGNLMHQTDKLRIATARSGNVIAGGDWSQDRIIPDLIRAIESDHTLTIRNPSSTRPWQHVLDPLTGYLSLAQQLHSDSSLASSFNFGPSYSSIKTVKELVLAACQHTPFKYQVLADCTLHEASLLSLNIDKARTLLAWRPSWSFTTAITRTLDWYVQFYANANAIDLCIADIHAFLDEYDNF